MKEDVQTHLFGFLIGLVRYTLGKSEGNYPLAGTCETFQFFLWTSSMFRHMQHSQSWQDY